MKKIFTDLVTKPVIHISIHDAQLLETPEVGEFLQLTALETGIPTSRQTTRISDLLLMLDVRGLSEDLSDAKRHHILLSPPAAHRLIQSLQKTLDQYLVGSPETE